MTEEKPGKKTGIQVIARAAAIMRALGANPKGLSLTAIAGIVELPRSTVQRIIYALESEKLVKSLKPGNGYQLGPALALLSQKSYGDIILLIRRELQELSNSIDETVALSCIRSNQICVIDRVVAETKLGVIFPLGYSMPGHSTSDGKILLSTLSQSLIFKWVGTQPQKFTEHTLQLDELLTQIATIRETGFAEDHEEHSYGICSISTLLPTYMGDFAITVVAPKERYFKNLEHYKEALSLCKIAIEQNIG
ncbi:IclR family transcriptional regulator [Celerinatantimonas sp. YJH-8]|uniref:IclR family transcriptional regulator n=1 Tax=Celerinatantimonas sp. YJH-8 TaxID=3228714 RepID=UPI0038CB9EF8